MNALEKNIRKQIEEEKALRTIEIIHDLKYIELSLRRDADKSWDFF